MTVEYDCTEPSRSECAAGDYDSDGLPGKHKGRSYALTSKAWRGNDTNALTTFYLHIPCHMNLSRRIPAYSESLLGSALEGFPETSRAE